jgi:hypothetical protein
MSAKTIYVKDKLDALKRKKGKVKFKDLDFTLDLKDTAVSALLLSPLISDDIEINKKQYHQDYDEIKINQALSMIEDMFKDRLSVLFFIGKYASYEKDKFIRAHKNYIKDEVYGLNIHETEEVKVVFYLNGNPLIHYTDEMSYDTTVISFCRLGIYIYAIGGVIAKERNFHQLPTLLYLFDSLGIDMETYSFAYLYHKIKKEYPEKKDMIWDFKNSVLIKSFCDTFMSMNEYLKSFLRDGRPKRYNVNPIKNLLELIQTFPIDKIMDIPYEIVVKHLYEY